MERKRRKLFRPVSYTNLKELFWLESNKKFKIKYLGNNRLVILYPSNLSKGLLPEYVLSLIRICI